MIQLLSFISLLLVAAGPGSPEADTTGSGLQISIAPKPEAFYAPARGLGAGAELTLLNLGWEGSRAHVSAVTMTRHGEYGVFFFSAEPREARLFGGAGVRYTGTRAYTFYGMGPATRREDAVRLTARRAEAELRLGWRPTAAWPLVVQPGARLLYDRMRGFEEVEEGALERLAEPSARNLERSVETPSTGVELGVAAILDLLDEPHYPSRGVLLQAATARYLGIDRDPFGYWRATGVVHGAVPVIGTRTIVEGRAVLTLTRQAGPDRPVPFFALPALDGELVGGYSRYRMAGRDLVALSAGLRLPLVDLLGKWRADVFAGVHLGAAYDDVFAQFEPRVTFARDPARALAGALLRPALSIGGYLVDLGRGLPVIAGQVGLSPEGVQLVGLEFVVDLRTRRPPVR